MSQQGDATTTAPPVVPPPAARVASSGSGEPSILPDTKHREEPIPDRRYRLPVLVALGAFLLALVFLLEARRHNQFPSLWFYWAGLVLTVAPGILSRSRIAAAFGVALFVFLQAFSYILGAPNGIVYSTDPIYNFQAVTVLATRHFWSPGLGSVQAILYSFYPGSTFYEIALAMVTGLPASATFMFATDLLRFAVLPLAIFKFLTRFVSDKPSLVAVALIFASPSYILNLPVLQEFAIVFLVLGLYAVYRAPWSSRRFALSPPAMTAAFVFLSTVALSHYFTAYIFAFFLGALALVSLVGPFLHILKGGPARQLLSTRALTGFRYAAPAFAYVFLLWFTFVSSRVDIGWFTYGQIAFQDALSPGATAGGVPVTSHGVRPGYTYTTVEVALIAGAVALWILLGFLGALLVSRRASADAGGRGRTSTRAMLALFFSPTRAERRKLTSARVMLSLFAICLMIVFVTVPLVFTRGFFVPLRVYEFAGLGLAPLAGFLLSYLIIRKSAFPKLVAVGAISVLIIGGSLLPLSSPRFYYLARNVQYSEMPLHETPDVVAAALWAKDHIPRSVSVFGDELAYDIFGGYGQLAPGSGGISGFYVFRNATFDLNASRTAGIRAGDILVVDMYMTKSICFAAYNDAPLPQAGLDKFKTSPLVAELFQNEAVTIYRWNGPD